MRQKEDGEGGALLVTNQFVVGKQLLHLVGHQEAGSSCSDMDDTNRPSLRVELIFDLIRFSIF